MDENSSEDIPEKRVRKAPSRDAEGNDKRGNTYMNRLNRRSRELLATDRQNFYAEEVCKRYLRGEPQYAIAADMGIAGAVVRDIINQSRDVWLERAGRSMAEMKSEQLAKIDRVEFEAWLAYDRSQRSAKETQTAEEVDMRVKTKTRTTTRKRDGSADWLRLVLDCVKQRSALLGLDNPDQGESQQRQGVLVVVQNPQEAQSLMSFQDFAKTVVDAPPAIEVSE